MENINDILLEYFNVEYIIFCPQFYKGLEFCNDEFLQYVLNVLKNNIENNEEKRQYTDTTKKNLYNILSVIRYRFKDKDILEEVNRLILILNRTDSINSGKCLYDEFILRCRSLIDKKTFKLIDETNIFEYENIVYESIENDHGFFLSLLNDDEQTFLDKNINKAYTLTNVSYILNAFPEIMYKEDIYNKISKYLYNFMLMRSSNIKVKKCIKLLKKHLKR